MSTPLANSGLDLARLIREHQAGVWRYLRVLGCSTALADDLTQDTFLAVLQKPFEVRGPAATASYLRTVARNLWITTSQRENRYITAGELDELDVVWDRWAGRDGGEQLLAALESCLRELSDRARQALNLRYRCQQPRREIAAALQMSEDGAKNLLQRAKEQLRACIERKLP
jgi:RNA polymerase sigma-70 factor (ECF subfamily)